MEFEWWMAAVAGWLAVETLKMVVNHKTSVRTREEDLQVEDMQSRIKDVHKTVKAMNHHVVWLRDMHDVKDDDGLPIWYIPRSWATRQEKIVTTINEMSHTLKDVAHIVEKVVDKLDNHSK